MKAVLFFLLSVSFTLCYETTIVGEKLIQPKPFELSTMLANDTFIPTRMTRKKTTKIKPRTRPSEPSSNITISPPTKPPHERERQASIVVDYARFVSATYKGGIAEPAVASQGAYWFYTMNWDAAYSTNFGSTWTRVNPFADMTDFCCDQDVVYAGTHGVFIWFRQSVPINGENYIRLNILSSTFSAIDSYDMSPTDVNPTWTNQWFDYPSTAVSNANYFLSINIFDSNDVFVRVLLLRFPLSQLAVGGSITFDGMHTDEVFTIVLAEGATSTMYFASHMSQTVLRVWKLPDGSSNLQNTDITHQYYSNNDYTCLDPSGSNWCTSSSDRLMAGWVANGIIGFMWDASRDAQFPQCYIAAVEITASTMTLRRNYQVYSSTTAYRKPHVSVNSGGNLALSFAFGSSATYASHAFAVFDPSDNSWSSYPSILGNQRFLTRYGDYFRVRPHFTTPSTKSTKFIGSGYTLQGGTCADGSPCSYVVPIAVLFTPSFISPVTTGIVTTGVATCGSFTLTAATGSFSRYPGYNYDNCLWKIVPPLGYARIQVDFNIFNTESGYDFVRLYDGPTVASPLLGSYSGNLTPFSVSSSQGSSVTITFTADSSEPSTGFTASYTCISTTTGVVTPLTSGRITTSPVTTSLLTTGFDLTSNVVTSGIAPVTTAVEISTASLTTAAREATTGSVTSGSSTSSCGSVVLTSSNGTFSQMPYSNDDNCIWYILSGGNAVRVAFTLFSTETDYDVVSVYDGATLTSPVLGRYSGNLPPFLVTSTQGNVLVNFISDSLNPGNGFSVTFQVLYNSPATTGLNALITTSIPIVATTGTEAQISSARTTFQFIIAVTHVIALLALLE